MVDKINGSIIIKEWTIPNGDVISKLKDYKRDFQEELRIVKIKLRNLKVSEKRIDELTS